MSTYIIRAKSHGYDYEDEFLDGRISIGWPCKKDLTSSDRGEIKSALQQAYGRDEITETAVSMVEEFMGAPESSIILNPSISNRSLIHIFRTTGTCQYDVSRDNDEYGNPHAIQATHLRTVARSDLPERIIRSLSGARKTVSNISRHSEVIEAFLDSPYTENVEKEERKKKNTAYKADAFLVLYNLLDSESEDIRLKAAIGLLNIDDDF